MRAYDNHAAAMALTDPHFGKLGYLVIDTAYYGKSLGGVRILPDVCLEEISHMARTMTRKYLFTGIPCGGAKAGRSPPLRKPAGCWGWNSGWR